MGKKERSSAEFWQGSEICMLVLVLPYKLSLLFNSRHSCQHILWARSFPGCYTCTWHVSGWNPSSFWLSTRMNHKSLDFIHWDVEGHCPPLNWSITPIAFLFSTIKVLHLSNMTAPECFGPSLGNSTRCCIVLHRCMLSEKNLHFPPCACLLYVGGELFAAEVASPYVFVQPLAS